MTGPGTDLIPIFLARNRDAAESLPMDLCQMNEQTLISLPLVSSVSFHFASQEQGNIWPQVWMAGEMQ